MFHVIMTSSVYELFSWLDDLILKVENTEKTLRKMRKKTPEQKALFESSKKRWYLLEHIKFDLGEQCKDWEAKWGQPLRDVIEKTDLVDIGVDLDALCIYWREKAEAARIADNDPNSFTYATYMYLVDKLQATLNTTDPTDESPIHESLTNSSDLPLDA